MKSDPLHEAIKVIVEYGFQIDRVDNSRVHLHIYTKPEYRFIAPRSPGDHRWLLNFTEDVRTAARELKVPHSLCPRLKCKNMYLAYESDGMSIKRCDVCHQSLFTDGKKVSTQVGTPQAIQSSPSSEQRKPAKD